MPASRNTSETVKRIGRKIAGARAERGLTQAAVAAVAGTTRVQVSNVETAAHKNGARVDTMIRIAEAVGLRITLEPAA